ncbi:helix-turn-helix domain-containing protein [Acidimicrobiaceae bacterium USS-CC1]|uniref:Helix-turn-helix domain-containing protein n=1 Tax=Acidiferrimicrobium australe TaxID=2664430 RepID=A0ABW9QWA3_9ACTN|nr:helix-turn-helix domain-containing protein [Acidiferrimicrobium australe]
MGAATYTTEQLAELCGLSAWALYSSVRRGDPPVQPIRVGRRIVWPKAAVDALLGIGGDQ